MTSTQRMSQSLTMENYTRPEDLQAGTVYEMWIGWGCSQDGVKSQDTYIYGGLSQGYHRFESLRQCATGPAVIHLVPTSVAKHYKFAASASTETEVETGC